MRRWVVSLILFGSLIGLVGCVEKTTAGKASEQDNQLTEQEKKLEEQKASEAAKKAVAEAEAKRIAEEEAKKPKVVNVVDPSTKNVVKSLIPVEIGFGIDNEKYRQELEKMG